MGIAVDGQYHVLAVDDSIVDRKLIEKLLKTSSFHVTAVDCGSKALEVLGIQQNSDSNPVSDQKEKVNLVITDYSMPGMNGYDLLKRIKESGSVKDIPVVIMSSENIPSRISKCLEEGAEEFFLKPVKLSDVNKLRPHIERKNSGKEQSSSSKDANEGVEKEAA
ncbi:Signal transduction response regulator, receiver domain [Dillenia turbinata]|uniref:Signal transduction response regulator, receiver domain n=1 Tax=Dillenia turbinata TaxID=194707 RepID=A0AAN8V6Q8_9MAGN